MMKRNTQDQEKEWVKIATRPQFNLYQNTMETTHWQIRLKASGGYLRRRFNAPNLNEALEQAPVVAGLMASGQQPNLISLADAFTMALKATTRRDRSRKDWLKSVEKFFIWLQKHHPLATHWRAMTRQILREYLASYDGKSANYRRLSMQPLLQTASFMHREYDFPAIGERLGIGSKLKTLPKTVYLEDVLSFCDFLKTEGSHLEIGAALQGLAGLQLLEALRLTWDQVDLKRGLIEISGEVKNEYRNRVIPVTTQVLDALRRADQTRRTRKHKVVSVVEGVVVGAKGLPYEDHPSYSRQMHKAFMRWNSECDWAPKDLRNCLPTFAKIEGVHGTIWEQYIGHAPNNVTDRHYVPRMTAKTPGEEAALDRQMQLFRRFVTEQIEVFQSKQICKNLQLTESNLTSAEEKDAASLVV